MSINHGPIHHFQQSKPRVIDWLSHVLTVFCITLQNDDFNLSHISTVHDSSRLSIDGFLASVPGSYQRQQKKKRQLVKANSNLKQTLRPASTLSTTSLGPPVLSKAVLEFQELARVANIKLPTEIMPHIYTLLEKGVPADDVYLFLKECINGRRNSVEDTAITQNLEASFVMVKKKK